MSDERFTPSGEHDETRAVHAPLELAARPEMAGMPAEVDGYRIVGVLGQGGMGVVYEAEQREPRRRVALKVVRGSAHTDELHVRLFRREAETLGRLRHPNIGAIYGSGRLPDGRPYFAMELVEGPTLDRYLAGRPSPANRDELAHRLALARKIAEAVHYAHQRGVIHRDLKPGNIVITAGYASGTGGSSSAPLPEVKVLDFGLARITDDDSGASLMSDVGTIRGTLPYMSPEQARGETATLDVRSDVYALGVILYEMIAGQRPYDVSRAAVAEAVRVIGEQAPRPLRDTPSGVTRVDPDLQTIVAKALAKDAEQRYSSAAALAEDLERFAHSQPILARAPSAAYQLRKLVARHRPLVATLAAAMVAIVVAAIVSTAMFVRARTEAAKARQVSAFLSDMLGSVGPSVAKGRDTALLREILERTAKRVRTELAKQPDVAAGIEAVLGKTYLQMGELEQAEPHVNAALAIHRRLHRGTDADVATDLGLLVAVRWRHGQLAAAEKLAREVLAMRRALHAGPDDETAQALSDLGNIITESGRFEEAEPLLREALAMQQTVHAGDHEAIAVGFNSLGNLMHYTGRYASSDSLYRLALAMHRRLDGDLHPDVEVDLANLGQLEVDRGHIETAESLMVAALETGRRIFPGDHPDLIASLTGLSQVLRRKGAFARAESLDREAVAMATRLNGPGTPPVADAMTYLASVLAESQGPAAALPVAREALAIHARTLPPGDARLAGSLSTIASIYSDVGQFAAADSAFRAVIPLFTEIYGADNPNVLLALNNYARMKLNAAELTAADSLFRAVLAGRRKVLGEKSDQVAVSMNDLALVQIDRGQLAEADTLLAHASAVMDSTLGPESMNAAFVRGSHGVVLADLGRMADAEAKLRRARAQLVKVFGPADGNVLWLNVDLARVLSARGNVREADSLYRSLLAAAPGVLGKGDVIETRTGYGALLGRTGRFAEGEKLLLAAEASLREPTGPGLHRRIAVLEALVSLEAAWQRSAPSAARAAALARWTRARDAEVPELTAAMRGPGVAAVPPRR